MANHPYGKVVSLPNLGGRPPLIDTPAGEGPDGQPMTTSDRILMGVLAGMVPESAAAAAGVDRQTYYQWLKEGARVIRDLQMEKRTVDQLTDNEVHYARFANGVHQLQNQGKLNYHLTAQQLAEGGIEQVERRTKTRKVLVDGEDGDKVEATEVETTTVTRQTLPDKDMVRFMLQSRWPEDYLPTMRVAHEGEISVDVRTTDEKRSKLSEALDVRATRIIPTPQGELDPGQADESEAS